jgi:hypothetical protein
VQPFAIQKSLLEGLFPDHQQLEVASWHHHNLRVVSLDSYTS